MTIEIEHRCPQSGKVERIRGQWLSLSKESTGFCDKCKSRIYADKQGTQHDRVQLEQ